VGKQAGKVLTIGVGLVGGGAKVALGMDTGAARLSSWRSKKFCGAVMALKTSAANCPLNVAHMRALTDHAIPEFLLSENSAIEGAEVEGMRAEWHFPSEFLLHHIALHARATTLHGGCRSVVLRTDACAVGVCRLAADACLPACLAACFLFAPHACRRGEYALEQMPDEGPLPPRRRFLHLQQPHPQGSSAPAFTCVAVCNPCY
jgi:hypothetical protein